MESRVTQDSAGKSRLQTSQLVQRLGTILERSRIIVQSQLASSTYEYEPLSESISTIRTLMLQPGPKSAAIHVTLHHTPLDTTRQSYDALSYAWGDPKKTKLIYVGLDKTKTLSVTRNLRDALVHLRHETEPRELWIDAICIDQSNLQERGSQVQMMKDIFKWAHRVVVWLGLEADDSSHAMALMESLASKVDIDWHTKAVKPSLISANEPHWADIGTALPFRTRDWRALYCLLGRAWFERLWVRQEISFSRENAIVMCATATILWEDFRKANFMTWICAEPLENELSPQEIATLDQRGTYIDDLADYYPNDPIWQVLRGAGFSKCSDPRDKVYANLGFVQETEGDIGLKPNYDQSVREVSIQLVVALLRFHKRLDILRCCELADELEGLPSWTPNWMIRTIIFGVMDCGAGAPADARYLGNGVLRVEGIVGGVLEHTRVYQESEYQEAVCSEICKLAPKNLLGELDSDGAALLDSFCRALCGGRFRDLYPSREDSPDWQSSRQTVSEILGADGNYDTRSYESNFLGWVHHYGRGRCFFTTENGKMGWAPKSARAGDIVCVILGCEAPLVLRETAKASYQVVGECYVDGIMDGELVLGALPENFRKVGVLSRKDGLFYPKWTDTVTGEEQSRDPRRLRFVKEGESSDHVTIGTSWHWPFLTSERLKKAGVKLQSFDLV